MSSNNYIIFLKLKYSCKFNFIILINYMALIISNKFKYIFFHLPKNAGTTVSNKLFEIETFYFKKTTIHILKIIKNKKSI